MKNYETASALANTQIEKLDMSRNHAINYTIAMFTITFVTYIALWTCTFLIWDRMPAWTLFLSVPISFLAGAVAGGYKLIVFTEEYRDYLYALEVETQTDWNQDGHIGAPDLDAAHTVLLGVDGAYHRMDSNLSPEQVEAIKRLLLRSEKATVRSLTDIVGDRASHFRDELIGLGVCEKPKYDRGAAPLSEAGRKVVMRWSGVHTTHNTQKEE